MNSELQYTSSLDSSINKNDNLMVDDDLLLKLTNELLNPIPGVTELNEVTSKISEPMTFQHKLQPQLTYQYNRISTVSDDLEKNMMTVPFYDSSLFNTSSTEKTAIDSVILSSTIRKRHNQRNDNVSTSAQPKVHSKHSTTVTPVDFVSNCNIHINSNTIQVLNDSVCQEECLQCNIVKPEQIEIKCQPRSKFRPRTQSDSKFTSHYIRCEDGAELEYPTIYIPRAWAIQSDSNIIEVSLMDIRKQPHPYTIDNKTSAKYFENEAFIFKQNEANTLYFRLANQDFLNGYKTFMIELIKSKQNDVITKSLIRSLKLDQSMLRFTRIYRDQTGKYQRHIDSETYSCIMQESYGDVTVDHISPYYGPMCGQSMIFIICKGRIVKDDLSISIHEQTTNWSRAINNFILNGNVAYFLAPAFPFRCKNNIKATINIYLKKQKVYESIYYYMSILDRMYF